MSVIYYLFLDLDYHDLDLIFQKLKSIHEPGINFNILNKHDFLPSYITINTLYKDNMFKQKIKKLLLDLKFTNSYEILKPLHNQSVFYPTSLEYFPF